MSIVVATTNRGKLAEIRAMLARLPVEVLSLADALGDFTPIAEDGDTFEANARLKASQTAEQTMMVTLADDSGLEVDALGGRPGVRSARFASEHATDADNNAELLRLMEDVDDDGDRRARFRCAIALVDPWDPEGSEIVEASCEGRIAHKPSGTGGYGYDPLFIVDDADCTMAELDEGEKNSISHRARALSKIRPKLQAIIHARLFDAARILGQQPAGRAPRA